MSEFNDERAPETRRLLGVIEEVTTQSDGSSMIPAVKARVSSIFGGGEQRLLIPADGLEAVGVEIAPGRPFMFWGNLAAETPDDVHPTDFEHVEPLSEAEISELETRGF